MIARMAADILIGPASDLSRPRRRRGSSSVEGTPDGSPGIGALFISGNPMNGTEREDFMFGVLDGPDHTINAGDSADLVLADMGAINSDSKSTHNDALITALSIDDTSLWTTDENPLFSDSSTPHATAYVEATEGEKEFFSLTIGMGQIITIDIDYGNHEIGLPTGATIALLDAAGNVLASNNDGTGSDEGYGSDSHSRDAFLTFAVESAGVYYIRIDEGAFSPVFEGGENFLLNISVTDHATTSPTQQGDDTIRGSDGDDQLFGLDGDDSIDGSNGRDFLHGGSGRDILVGGSSGDILDGGNGNDVIFAASLSNPDASGDRMIGDKGADSLVGSDGEDTILGGSLTDTVIGGNGRDFIFIRDNEFIDFIDGGDGPWFDTLNLNAIISAGQAVFINLATGMFTGLGGATTIAGIEQIRGTQLNDTLDAGNDDRITLRGGRGDDQLEGGLGFQSLQGEEGDDTIVGDNSASPSSVGDTLDGAAGNDWILGAAGDDSIFGGADEDTADGGLGGDSILGDDGEDHLFGGEGRDTIRGGLDFDVLFGDAGIDLLFGEDGADTLTGGGGDDSLDGGLGKDSMLGGNGVDLLFGGDANDTLAGDGDGDALNGGNGIDWADYSSSGAKVVADLRTPASNTHHAAGDSYTLIENLRGTAQRDSLSGDLQSNRIEGVGGNDSIAGRSGDDTLAGGAGKDKLRGGEEADDFELASLAAADADVILDFAPGADRIALVGDVFGLPAGALDPTRFVIGGQAQDANDRLIYKAGQGKLYFDPDGDGAQTQVLIATLTGAPALGAGDFVVI